MTKQTINVGEVADDGTGDSLRVAFIKCNDNFTELYDNTVTWANVQDKPDPTITVTLTGDVTGTASTTLTELTSGTISVATTVEPNSIVLGTDTTGNYVADITAGVHVVKTGGEFSEGQISEISVYATSSDTPGAIVSRDANGDFDAFNVHVNLVTARFAALTETYIADDSYGVGTLVKIGGVNEVTIVNDDLSTDVFGVVNEQLAAGLTLNTPDGVAFSNVIPVTLTGRAFVRLTGTAVKGDRLVSAGNGVARVALPSEINGLTVIGKALEDKPDPLSNGLFAFVSANK